MGIWIAGMGLALLVAVLLVLPMFRRPSGDASVEAQAATADIQIYRDQLKELERDRARRVISEAEAEQARLEVSRRLLEADHAAQVATTDTRAAPGLRYALAAVVVAVAMGATGLLYNQLGAPGYPDLPLAARIAAAQDARENRPSQQAAEADVPVQISGNPEHLALVEQLRAAMQERPDDLMGQQLLAENEARIGNFPAAHAAMRRVIEIKGPDATVEDYVQYADLLVVAANGYISPEAEDVLLEIQARDPDNQIYRFYAGMMFGQIGRPDIAFNYWAPLLRDSPPDAPWVPIVRDRIEEIARRAGVRYSLPETAPGPDAAAIAAAQDMSDEDRQAMIRNMVEGLATRLADEGGTPDEWARLIGALGVLDETDRAMAIWSEAQVVFADSPEALEPINAAAAQAGLTE